MKYFVVIALVLCRLCSFGQVPATQSVADLSPETILKQLLQPSNGSMLVAAHRGDWRNAPENSIHAIKLCLEMGVDIMETDIKKTKDGVLVLMHDESIDRTTSGKGKVSELTFDSLQKVWLRQGHGGLVKEKIPTLEEAMLYVKGKPILINLDKAWDFIPETYAVLQKTGTVDQAIFKGNQTLAELRKRYGSLMDSIHYMPMVWPMDYNIYGNTADSPESYVAGFYNNFTPAAFEVVFNNDTTPTFTRALPAIRSHNTAVWINTLWDNLCAGHTDEAAMDAPDEHWGWVIENGATIIQTDRPQQLLAYLRRRSLHK